LARLVALTHSQHIDIDRIDALLPQTQCQKCGFDGCRPYAEAIHAGKADINQCPPGGRETIAALAQLLGLPEKPLNPEHGAESPPQVAFIDETSCIGCVKCIKACPVDAIVGARRHMHTVIAAECTGCELCLPPCPVDCIRLVPAAAMHINNTGDRQTRATHFRDRYLRRQARLVSEAAGEKNEHPYGEAVSVSTQSKEDKLRYVQAAVARSRARRKGRPA
jgi:Na+-translocating ferredoxin:NAD+ oxidoreductase subunit B